jgi:hypothetical protein
VNEVGVLAAMREVQIPMLTAMLITGFAAKSSYLMQTRTADARMGPTATFPLGSRRPAAAALCVIELALGTGLLLTATYDWASPVSLAVRVAVTLLFGTGAGALWVMRARRPETGCGCFGELSITPVGWRVIVRAVLLCLAALALLDAPPLHMPASAGQAWLTLGLIVGEIVVIMALSPEVSQLMLRLSHADPCEVREVSAARTGDHGPGRHLARGLLALPRLPRRAVQPPGRGGLRRPPVRPRRPGPRRRGGHRHQPSAPRPATAL